MYRNHKTPNPNPNPNPVTIPNPISNPNTSPIPDSIPNLSPAYELSTTETRKPKPGTTSTRKPPTRGQYEIRMIIIVYGNETRILICSNCQLTVLSNQARSKIQMLQSTIYGRMEKVWVVFMVA